MIGRLAGHVRQTRGPPRGDTRLWPPGNTQVTPVAPRPSGGRPGRGGPTMAAGTIRYWAAARTAAGLAEESWSGSTLGEVLAAAADRHGPELARVLSVASFLVDGTRTRSEASLEDGSTIEVLPPFAGG